MECALKSSLRKEMGVKVLSQQDDFWAVDGQNVVACDDFFVDELLDLSNEDDTERDEPVKEREEEEDEKQSKCEEVEGGFAGKDEFVDIPTGEITVPAEDLWLSHFVEDSFSEYSAAPFLAGATPEKPMEMVPVEKIQGLAGSGGTRFKTPVPAKARSKRVRPGGRVWSSLTESSAATPTSSATSSSSCSSPSSPWLIYSHPYPNPVYSGPGRVWKKQRKAARTGTATEAAPRRCSHCGVQKTPQWRTGPLGAKTLCNACGVRFKSGRLLPEYRPACSPTFSSELHSNHHRKVMEMRRKKEAPPLPDSGLGPRVVASF